MSETSHTKSSSKPEVSMWNFNYWISKLFLENSRLTALTLVFLLVVGVFSALNLKTTGFPNPTIPLALVQTQYIGASSEKVAKEVTIPLEGAIKDVAGVKRFNSTSSNSFSNITVFIDESADVNAVRSKIDSAVKSVKVPAGADSPVLVVPDIGGPSAILAVTGKNLEKVHDIYDLTVKKLAEVTDVSKIDPINNLNRQIVIKPKKDELLKYRLQPSDIQKQIATLGETLPVVSNVTIDGQNAGISTSVKGNDFQTLQNFEIAVAPISVPTAPSQGGRTNQNPPATPTLPTFVKLSELAEITVDYIYDEPSKASVYTLHSEETNSEVVLPAGILNLKTVENTDQAKFMETLKNELSKIPGAEYVKRDELSKKYDENKIYIVEAYAVNDDNKEQVDQVVGGIIGSPIGDEWWGKIGWLLGGIQLIILVMIAFVSWRAALVAASAIPLSLLFSTIYIWLIGEQLNTLVLFSLVLVLGLVVDPALVVLESIQRQIDTGHKGKEAVLEAIKDVGNGVFLAALTNVIVFVPFGILSGIFGQIFAYIPLTVIPAVIGSYVVPLVFLAWLGGIFLKPNKNAQDDEEKNLWPIAKWLMKFNYKILTGSRWLRLVIIAVGLIVPLSIAGLLFSNGSIKQVQFAQPDDSQLVILQGSFLPNVSKEDQLEATKGVMEIVGKNENVRGVVPISSNFEYYVFLNKTDEREIKAGEISKQIDNEIQDKFGANSGSKRKFFDIKADISSPGGPTSDYQVSLTVAEDDLDKLREASVNIANEIKSKLCIQDNAPKMKDDCSESNKLTLKIDDGFTDKDNLIYDVSLDRKAVLNSGLATPGQIPLSIAINQTIKNQFEYNNGDPIGRIIYEGEETNIVMGLEKGSPQTISQTIDETAKSLGTTPENIARLGEIIETKPKTSIQRIKGKTVGLIEIRFKPEYQTNQGLAGRTSAEIVNYFTDNNSQKLKDLGLEENSLSSFDDGQNADGQRFFTQLSIALLLAIVVSYIVLAVFFNSLSQPMGILYTIPLALSGVLPALVAFVGGQFGLLEIIGLIILVGIVENVAIFLIDSANQKVKEGMNLKKAISYASAVRFRPVALTSITAFASLAPLAILSPFYRSIAVVIMFGIMASGILSLVTTPILYVFFNWFSNQFAKSRSITKTLFFSLPVVGTMALIYLQSLTDMNIVLKSISTIICIVLMLMPAIYTIYWGIIDRPHKRLKNS